MAKHASAGRGGSVAERTINCTGWYTLPLQDQGSSEFADRGTMLHEAVALYDEGKLERPFEALGHKLTDELMADKIVPAKEALDAVLAVHEEKPRVLHENRVSLPIEGCFGTSDVVALSPALFTIADFKFGDGVMVSPVENDQLAYYAAASLYSMEELAEYSGAVNLAIIQPGNGAGYDIWETTTDWLEDWLDVYEHALNAPAAFKLGKWCRFCPAKLNCPAMHETLAAVPDEPPAGMSGEDLALWMGRVEYLERFIKAVQAESMARLEHGHPVPGFKLVKKRATRKWEDEALVEQELRMLRVKVGDMMNMKLKTPAQIEKLKLTGKKAARVTDVVAKLAHSVSSGHNVVPDTDSRPASGTLASAASRLRVLSGKQ